MDLTTADLQLWAEIDLDNLSCNFRQVRSLTGVGIPIVSCIKANGYGHGAVAIAETLVREGTERFAVATLDEGIELRLAGYTLPILILGYTNQFSIGKVVKHDLIQTIYSWEQAECLSAAAAVQNKMALIHIKIDTGMRRLGLPPTSSSVGLIKEISKLPYILIEGIYTHFAKADAKDKRFTHEQHAKFMWICDALDREGVAIELKHCGNSAAIIDLPEMHMNMVRAGIMLYGLQPSAEINGQKLSLKPAMSLKVRVTHVKSISAGDSIGYGCKFIASKPMKIATLAVGYADGFSRMLSGKAEVLINGIRVAVVGNICMNQCMIDVTDAGEVAVGGEVVLCGQQGAEWISADEIAHKLGTISYEVICMVNPRVPRVYVAGGKIVGISNPLLGVAFNPTTAVKSTGRRRVRKRATSTR